MSVSLIAHALGLVLLGTEPLPPPPAAEEPAATGEASTGELPDTDIPIEVVEDALTDGIVLDVVSGGVEEEEIEIVDEEPAVAVAPSILPPPTLPEIPTVDASFVVVKTLIGLLALIVLAYLGGHPRIQRLEATIGISRAVAAGLPFLVLGLIAGSDAVGILSDRTIEHMRPILHLGLGWLGLTVGMRLQLQRMSALPRGTPTILGIGSGIPFLGIVVAGGLVLAAARHHAQVSVLDPDLLRDALVLGTAGAVAADTESLRQAARRAGEAMREKLVLLTSLDEMVGLVGLGFITAYFRPSSTWALPETVWLFITFGLPACVGCVVYVIFRLPASANESIALLFGIVAFTAGMASELRLSALVVCFFVGVLLANFPGDYHGRLRDLLERLEAPIYSLFLIVAGALWNPSDSLGWALMVLVLGTRLMGRWIGGRIVWNRLEDKWPVEARRALVVSPLGALPIAIVVNAELLYPGDTGLSLVMTAIIGGTMLAEFFTQMYFRAQPPAPLPAPEEPG